MDYRDIFVVILIILILAAGYFFYKDVELDPQNVIVHYIEEQSGYQIDYSSAKLWPLNEINIKDLNLVGDNFILRVSKVKIGYSIFDYFNETNQAANIIKYINMENPDLVYNGPEDTGQTQEITFTEIKNTIFNEIDEVYINISKGNIHINNQPDGIYELNSLSTEIKINSQENNIRAQIKKGFSFKGPVFDGINLEDYPTNNFSISAELDNDNWDLYLKNEEIDLAEYEKLVNKYELDDLNDYQVDNLNGKAAIALHLKGIKEEIESYQANIELASGSFEFKLKDKSYQEKLNITGAKLHLDSTENKMYLDNLDFKINDNSFNFQGRYDLSKNNYSGELIAKNFELDDQYINNFLKEEIDYDFSTEGNFIVNVDGDLENISILSDLNLDKLTIMDYQFIDMNAKIRYLDGSFYLDNLNSATLNGGKLEMEGIYDLAKDEYHLNVKGNKIKPLYYYNNINLDDTIRDYDLENYIEGDFNFELTTTGSSNIKENIASGSVSFVPDEENLLRGNGIREVSSNFLYENDKLFIEEGNVKINGDNLNMFGELNLKESNIYVKLKGEDIGLSFLNHNFDFKLAEQNKISIDTLIQGDFSNPFVKGKIESEILSYQDYSIRDLLFDFTFTESKLDINDFNFVFDSQQFNGKGILNLGRNFELDKSNLDLTLTTEAINYNKLKKFIDFELPIMGSVKPEMRLHGSIDDLQAEGDFVSDNTKVTIAGQTYEFDQVKTLFNWSYPANIIRLENGVIRKGDFNIVLDGQYKEEKLDVNFSANNLDLNELGIDFDAAGQFNLDGNLAGEIAEPSIDLNFSSNNFRYNRLLTDEFGGQISYNNGTIEFKDINLKKGSSNYNMLGQVSTVLEDPDLDLTVNTERGNLEEIIRLTDYEIPYDLDYDFKGEVGINGKLDKPEVRIGVSVIYNFTDIIDIEGEIGDQINLNFTGREVPLNLIEVPGSFDESLNYSGKISFEGQFKGTREEYNVELSTQLEEPEIEGLQFGDISGDFSYNSGGILEFSQNLPQSENRYIRLRGAVKTKERYISDIQLDFNNYNLAHLSSINNNIKKIAGNIDGDINLRGDISNPQLSGEMKLEIPELDVQDIEPIKDIQGELTFNEEKIRVSDFAGIFGEGSFKLSGDINYMNRDNFWDIRLKGDNLSLNIGSFNGKVNPDIRVLNEFRRPLIFGEVNINDFVVGSDLNFPTSDGGSTSFFEPEVKLTMIPGNDVYFRDENIDIPVEGGSLKLNYIKGELTLIGDLNSNQGSLDYYNNKFIIDTVNASFEQFSDNIPIIHLVGRTTTSNTKIYIYVDGPADNLNISFGSEPELPEDEIIALLTRSGGLRGFTSDDDEEASPGSLILSEIYRYISERIQLDFVQNIERSLGDILELNRFEVDTYSFAGEREVTVYLGKDITDELYLQYTGTFSPNKRENELTFEYDINKYLNLEGGWYGEDDYRFLLETTIEF